MAKRINGIAAGRGLCLSALLLSLLCTARSAEAIPKPDKIDNIILKLETKLSKVITKATKRKETLSNSVAINVEKFINEDISSEAFCKKLRKFKAASKKARLKCDKKITTATEKSVEALRDLGGIALDYVNKVIDMGKDAHEAKRDLFDGLDNAIENAKKEPLTPCL